MGKTPPAKRGVISPYKKRYGNPNMHSRHLALVCALSLCLWCSARASIVEVVHVSDARIDGEWTVYDIQWVVGHEDSPYPSGQGRTLLLGSHEYNSESGAEIWMQMGGLEAFNYLDLDQYNTWDDVANKLGGYGHEGRAIDRMNVHNDGRGWNCVGPITFIGKDIHADPRLVPGSLCVALPPVQNVCTFTQTDLLLEHGVVSTAHIDNHSAVTQLSIKCTQPSNVKVYGQGDVSLVSDTGSRISSYIAVNGSRLTPDGFGLSITEATVLELSNTTFGTAAPGDYKGATVLVVNIE